MYKKKIEYDHLINNKLFFYFFNFILITFPVLFYSKYLHLGGDLLLPFNKSFNNHWFGYLSSNVVEGLYIFTFYYPLQVFYYLVDFFVDSILVKQNLLLIFLRTITFIALYKVLNIYISGRYLLKCFIAYYYINSQVFLNYDLFYWQYYFLPIYYLILYKVFLENKLTIELVALAMIAILLSLIDLPQPKFLMLNFIILIYFIILNLRKYNKKTFIIDPKNTLKIIFLFTFIILAIIPLLQSFKELYSTNFSVGNNSSEKLLINNINYDLFYSNLLSALKFFHENLNLLPQDRYFYYSFIYKLISYSMGLFFLFTVIVNKKKDGLLIVIIIFFLLYLGPNFPFLDFRKTLLQNYEIFLPFRTTSGIQGYLFFFIIIFLIKHINQFYLNVPIIIILIILQTVHFLNGDIFEKLNKNNQIPIEYFDAINAIKDIENYKQKIFIINDSNGYINIRSPKFNYTGPTTFYNFLFNEIPFIHRKNEFSYEDYQIYDKGNLYQNILPGKILYENKQIVIIENEKTIQKNYEIKPINNAIFILNSKKNESIEIYEYKYSKYWISLNLNKNKITKINQGINYKLNISNNEKNQKFLFIFYPVLFLYLKFFLLILITLIITTKKIIFIMFYEKKLN